MKANKNLPKKYSLVLTVKSEYRRHGKDNSVIIDNNSLEKLMLLLDRHRQGKRRPWEYAHFIKSSQFKSRYIESISLLFLKLNT
jgi:hypothetical protein